MKMLALNLAIVLASIALTQKDVVDLRVERIPHNRLFPSYSIRLHFTNTSDQPVALLKRPEVWHVQVPRPLKPGETPFIDHSQITFFPLDETVVPKAKVEAKDSDWVVLLPGEAIAFARPLIGPDGRFELHRFATVYIDLLTERMPEPPAWVLKQDNVLVLRELPRQTHFDRDVPWISSRAATGHGALTPSASSEEVLMFDLVEVALRELERHGAPVIDLYLFSEGTSLFIYGTDMSASFLPVYWAISVDQQLQCSFVSSMLASLEDGKGWRLVLSAYRAFRSRGVTSTDVTNANWFVRVNRVERATAITFRGQGEISHDRLYRLAGDTRILSSTILLGPGFRKPWIWEAIPLPGIWPQVLQFMNRRGS